MKKRYKIRKGSIAYYAVKTWKPITLLAVVALTLGAFALASTAFAKEAPNEPTAEENTAVEAQEQAEPLDELEEETELVSLGEYTITYYCKENYPHICNDGDATRTATGTIPTPGRTIAVDPKVIPYGTEVIINGNTYIAEDCGGAINGNRIDIVVDTHEEALQCGIDHYEVFVKEGDL